MFESEPKETNTPEGRGLLIIGLGGSGKTTLAGHSTEKESRVIVAPDITNPWMAKIPRVGDSDETLNKLDVYMKRAGKDLLIILENDNPRVFDALAKYARGKTVILDDIATFLEGNYQMQAAFKKFLRKIRWAHIRLVITTHRAVGDIPPVGRLLMKEIYWVGPLGEEEDAKGVFSLRSSTLHPDFAGFFEKVKKLVPYNYKTRNFKEAVIVVAKKT
jgi:hypothetical protein